MNAPAKLPTARDRYIPIVKHHIPGGTAEDLRLRCSILLLRDQAASSSRRCSDEAAGVLSQVQKLASFYAFAVMPLEELTELRRQLVRLISCASGLEQFAFRLAYPGERDAGE